MYAVSASMAILSLVNLGSDTARHCEPDEHGKEKRCTTQCIAAHYLWIAQDMLLEGSTDKPATSIGETQTSLSRIFAWVSIIFLSLDHAPIQIKTGQIKTARLSSVMSKRRIAIVDRMNTINS